MTARRPAEVPRPSPATRGDGARHGSAPRALAALLLLWTTSACEVVTLEPDPDAGPTDMMTVHPILRDASIDALVRLPDADPPDLSLPASAMLMPMEIDFGDVEPYSGTQRSVSLRAGRDPLQVQAVRIAGIGFTLDPLSPQGLVNLGPGEMVRWTVGFTTEVAGRESVGELLILTDGGPRQVLLRGRGAWSGPACDAWLVEAHPSPPAAIEPGTALLLTGKAPATVTLGDVGLRWTAIESPLGPLHQPLERFDRADAPHLGGPADDPASFGAVIFAEKPGRYLFEARPVLPPGTTCQPEPSRIAVHACPCPERALTVRIGWQRAIDSPPGSPQVVPVLTRLSDGRWDRGSMPDAPVPDWGEPGTGDDPLIDVDQGDVSGRATIWIDQGPVSADLRLGVGVFDTSEAAGATVDITIDVFAGDEPVLAITGEALPAGNTFWDVAALVRHPLGWLYPVPYDRLLAADESGWPDFDAELDEGAPCDRFVGPRCLRGLRCVPGPGGERCRR